MLCASLLFYVLSAVTLAQADTSHLEKRHLDRQRHHAKRAYSLGPAWSGKSSLANGPKSGVSAMQLTVVGNNHVLAIECVLI